MTLAVVVVVLAAHNLVTNRWAPDWSYVPANLATAALLVALAGGVSFGGSLLAAVAVALVVLGAVAQVTVTRPGLLADRRMAGVDARGTAWRALVRIPLGTVVLEEAAFRGVLPALTSPVVASGLFGLWHVLPTARTLDVNGVVRARRAAIAGAVGVTTVVGLVLCELRGATGGLLAPALAHAAANSGATMASYVVLRSRPERNRACRRSEE
jgi:uncharacterized protein